MVDNSSNNNNNKHKATRVERTSTLVAGAGVAQVLDMLAVTLWLSLKLRRLLNWQSRRERLLASNSHCLVPVAQMITAPLAPAVLATLLRMISHRLLAVVVVVMVEARVWLLAAAEVMLDAEEETSSSPDLRRRMIRTTTRTQAQTSNVVAAKATEELHLATLREIGDSPTTNSNKSRITKLRTWVTST
jgi:hypothetical protein